MARGGSWAPLHIGHQDNSRQDLPESRDRKPSGQAMGQDSGAAQMGLGMEGVLTQPPEARGLHGRARHLGLVTLEKRPLCPKHLALAVPWRHWPHLAMLPHRGQCREHTLASPSHAPLLTLGQALAHLHMPGHTLAHLHMSGYALAHLHVSGYALAHLHMPCPPRGPSCGSALPHLEPCVRTGATSVLQHLDLVSARVPIQVEAGCPPGQAP